MMGRVLACHQEWKDHNPGSLCFDCHRFLMV